MHNIYCDYVWRVTCRPYPSKFALLSSCVCAHFRNKKKGCYMSCFHVNREIKNFSFSESRVEQETFFLTNIFGCMNSWKEAGVFFKARN